MAKTTAPLSDFYQIVGQNNRNLLVKSHKLSPFHEDTTKVTPFEPATVAPGVWTICKLDFKHGKERELILNDCRLRFKLDFAALTGTTAGKVGPVLAVRGTDFIREMIVRINNEEVFHVNKQFELSMLWEMNNHKTAGDPVDLDEAHMLNYGVIPRGHVGAYVYHDHPSVNVPGTQNWYFRQDGYDTVSNLGNRGLISIVPGTERWDGRPRLIYDDTILPAYMHQFDMSLNHLIGPILHRLHLRRIEYVQVEIMFEPWVSKAACQNFLLCAKVPDTVHPYSVAVFRGLELRQYRTTLLEGIQGFTLAPERMLSWLMHRYSRREYAFDFDNQTSIDIPLNDWEIRSNIVRLWWMLAPLATDGSKNVFRPFGEPCEGYERLSGVEILWKNEKVLDLDTHYEVYRHYLLSDNKRYGYDDPFMRFARLNPDVALKQQEVDGHVGYYDWMRVETGSTGTVLPANQLPWTPIGKMRYEFPIYHVDFHMNILQGVHGAEIIDGIVNDTSDYVIRLKRPTDFPNFLHTGKRTLWVWIEYQTLVNLAAHSNQYNRGSQVVTKQLNPV